MVVRKHNCTMYCYISIPPQKRKWFGFFCRDFLLRSLEKAEITAEEITEENSKFMYKSCAVVVNQEIETARLRIEVEYQIHIDVMKFQRLRQIFHESAEAVTSTFTEIEGQTGAPTQ